MHGAVVAIWSRGRTRTALRLALRQPAGELLTGNLVRTALPCAAATKSASWSLLLAVSLAGPCPQYNILHSLAFWHLISTAGPASCRSHASGPGARGTDGGSCGRPVVVAVVVISVRACGAGGGRGRVVVVLCVWVCVWGFVRIFVWGGGCVSGFLGCVTGRLWEPVVVYRPPPPKTHKKGPR
jgi:hypothetical protein